MVGEEADNRRPGQEGRVADRGGSADAAGRVPGLVGGGTEADRKSECGPEPHQRGAARTTSSSPPKAIRSRPARAVTADTRKTRTRPYRSMNAGPNQRPVVIAARKIAKVTVPTTAAV